MTHAPRWPGWTVPAAVGGLIVGGLLASLAVAAAGAALGAEDLTPALVLAIAAAHLVMVWLVLRLVAARAGLDLRPAGLGLRTVSPRMALVMVGFGLVVALAAAGLTSLLTDFDEPHPEELGGDNAVVVLDLASATTILARAILAAIALEIVLRGYLLPAVMQRTGRTAAILIVGALSAPGAPTELIPAAVAIGIALCVMYLESGSILPGIGLAGAVHGYVLGLSFDWTPAEAAALGAVAGLLAFLIVLGPTRSWDPGPARS